MMAETIESRPGRAARLLAPMALAGAVVLAFGMGGGPARAAESAPVTSPRITATLIAERDAVRPGERFHVALEQKIAPGWHTYWRNSGDSGEPTRIDWTLPAGVTAAEIAWPAPRAFPFAPLMNFGFKDRVLLPVEFAVPEAARPGETIRIEARATWLVCEQICIPEEGSFSLDLPVAAESLADASAQARIQTTLATLPRPHAARATLAADGERLALTVPGLPADAEELRFFPYSATLIDHAAPQDAARENEAARISLARSPDFNLAAAETSGVLTWVQAGLPRAAEITAEVAPALAAAPTAPRAGSETPTVRLVMPPAEGTSLTLIMALVFAFAGGLILNLMPCVLPVIFVKAFGFAQIAHAERGTVRLHGLLFLAGVLATFVALGGLVVGLGALGAGVGWGFQLQSPPVVIGLAVVMTLIGLNLLGAFEIGGRAAGIGQGLAGRGGRLGAFMTGVLAVVVATPCTAPFMGAAMGYAVTQPPALGLAVFLALALGFALPVVALSFVPALLALLPRPGRWMLVLKQALAFPMFASAIWLIWVASVQAGPTGVLAALGAILVAGFVVWLIGTTRESARATRLLSGAVAVALAVATGLFVVQAAVPAPAEARADGPGIWSKARVAELQARGQPVFVNFTAAWCITCIANERVALARQEVQDAFARNGVAYLKADWTNRDGAIAEALAEHGRAGVPLYLFYPGVKGAPAEILPQILTPDTLTEAAARIAAAGGTPRLAGSR